MSFDQFWLLYLRAIRGPPTDCCTTAAVCYPFLCLALAVLRREWWWLPAAPIIGYAFAWGARYAIEGNRPQTFGHPFWSLASDFRILGLWIAGLLGPQLERSHRPDPV
jgi:hypothetical protein